MNLKNLYASILLVSINCFFSCKKQETNSMKKEVSIKGVSNTKKIKQDILPLSFLDKYKSQKYFNRIIKANKPLVKDINRIHNNKTNIEYYEIPLDKYLTLCQFIFREEVQYDFYYRSEKLLYEAITPLNKAHYNFEYKDWNNDKKPEIITNYEQWEGGGGLGYNKIQSIYDVQDDTLMKIVTLPIKNIICQLGEISLIEELQYKYDSKTNELTIKKTVGTGNCDKNIIKNIKSKKTKNILLKKYDNGYIVFD